MSEIFACVPPSNWNILKNFAKPNIFDYGQVLFPDNDKIKKKQLTGILAILPLISDGEW